MFKVLVVAGGYSTGPSRVLETAEVHEDGRWKQVCCCCPMIILVYSIDNLSSGGQSAPPHRLHTEGRETGQHCLHAGYSEMVLVARLVTSLYPCQGETWRGRWMSAMTMTRSGDMTPPGTAGTRRAPWAWAGGGPRSAW